MPRLVTNPTEQARGGRLSPVARGVRAAVAVFVGGLMLASAFWGKNDDWPFTPMLQFALPTKANGVTWVTHAYGQFRSGKVRLLKVDQIGLRFAELDTQGRAIASNPTLLRGLARYYHRHHPDGPRLEAIWIQRDALKLRSGHPAQRIDRHQLLGRLEL